MEIFTTRKPAFMVFIGLALSLSFICGCFRRSIEVTPDDLPELSRYDKDHTVSVIDRGERIIVEPRFDPELVFLLKTKGRKIAADLEQLEVKDDEIFLAKAHRMFALKRYENLTLPNEEIRSIKLSLCGHVPPDWDPQWGLVFWLLGPGGFFGIGAQWYATDWLALDVGTSWVVGGISGLVGLRFLPVRWWFKPYIGASTTGIVFFDASLEETGAIAARFGIDIEFYNNRMLFRWELNMLYFLNKSAWPIDKMERDRGSPVSGFLPWMGFAWVVMY